MHAILFFVSSSILSWWTVYLILPYLKVLLLDKPNIRSSHSVPTPRGGGIAFVVVGTASHYYFSTGNVCLIPIICLPLALVGLIDDFRDLPAYLRYVVQVFTAIALVLLAKEHVSIWALILYVILITTIINFFNFMDGLDGLVAGCSVLLMSATSSWALSGAIFGFLLWNWSPAKVFMGDVGSTFIGSVFGGMIMQQSSFHDSLNLFLIGFPLFADASTCLIRRFIRGENIFRAHRDHLFQRLNKAGWPHSNVAILYILAVLLLAIINYIGNLKLMLLIILLEIIVGCILDVKLASRIDPT